MGASREFISLLQDGAHTLSGFFFLIPLPQTFSLFFSSLKRERGKRKSFVTAGETWLVIPSFISGHSLVPTIKGKESTNRQV